MIALHEKSTSPPSSNTIDSCQMKDSKDIESDQEQEEKEEVTGEDFLTTAAVPTAASAVITFLLLAPPWTLLQGFVYTFVSCHLSLAPRVPVIKIYPNYYCSVIESLKDERLEYTTYTE